MATAMVMLRKRVIAMAIVVALEEEGECNGKGRKSDGEGKEEGNGNKEGNCKHYQ